MRVTGFSFVISEEYLLDDVRNYRYLTHGNVNCTLDDNELYQELLDAFNIMGLNNEEIGGQNATPTPCSPMLAPSPVVLFVI